VKNRSDLEVLKEAYGYYDSIEERKKEIEEYRKQRDALLKEDPRGKMKISPKRLPEHFKDDEKSVLKEKGFDMTREDEVVKQFRSEVMGYSAPVWNPLSIVVSLLIVAMTVVRMTTITAGAEGFNELYSVLYTICEIAFTVLGILIIYLSALDGNNDLNINLRTKELSKRHCVNTKEERAKVYQNNETKQKDLRMPYWLIEISEWIGGILGFGFVILLGNGALLLIGLWLRVDLNNFPEAINPMVIVAVVIHIILLIVLGISFYRERDSRKRGFEEYIQDKYVPLVEKARAEDIRVCARYTEEYEKYTADSNRYYEDVIAPLRREVDEKISTLERKNDDEWKDIGQCGLLRSEDLYNREFLASVISCLERGEATTAKEAYNIIMNERFIYIENKYGSDN